MVPLHAPPSFKAPGDAVISEHSPPKGINWQLESSKVVFVISKELVKLQSSIMKRRDIFGVVFYDEGTGNGGGFYSSRQSVSK